jgi:hypothetical protein
MQIKIKTAYFEYYERLGYHVQNYFSLSLDWIFLEDIDLYKNEFIMNFVGFGQKCFYSKNTNLLKLKYYI